MVAEGWGIISDMQDRKKKKNRRAKRILPSSDGALKAEFPEIPNNSYLCLIGQNLNM